MKYWLIALLPYLLCCEEAPKNADAQQSHVVINDTSQAGSTVENASPKQVAPAKTTQFSYTLDKPDATFSLPNKLTEISGLSLSSDGRYLVAVNDEQGKVFFIDKNNGKLHEEIKFSGLGDYEGVEMVGEAIYVVKSNGNIYKVQNPSKKKSDAKSMKTDLSSDNDVEGLGYDSENNWLLLACKGKAGSGDRFKHQRAVYAFDLDKEKLLKDPLFLIDRNEIKKWAADGHNGVTEKLAEVFEPGLADDAFAPSGIAIHPATGQAYILSSVGKILVVLDKKGEIAHIEPLEADIHKQPEGICFDSDGTLFISNEGGKGKGKIYRFQAR